MTADWKPSRTEQRLLWWLKLLMRYPIGGGGVIYSVFVRPDALAILVFGAIATSMDVGQLAVMLFRAAREESRAIERLLDAEDDRPDENRHG